MMSDGHMKWRGSLRIRGIVARASVRPPILLSFIRETYLSLWDLLKLGGLPVTGRLFDEVVLTAECLSPTLDSDSRVPRSCSFLLRFSTSASICPLGPSVFQHRSWDFSDRYPFDILEINTG
ncbi:hypothetical protein LIER_29732 [Lithospermum erythrorhizon]|uniref:Uncharacterized protein n=1 Tax=Lithospermum erythrorhizon TaxID=34254 RepID=A0AAV3RLP1_LITER